MHEDLIEGFRLSPQQRRLWRLQQLDGAGHYFAQSAVLVEGVLRPEALRAAVEETVNRHEILRTTFRTLPEMETALQVIGPTSFLWQQARRPSDAEPGGDLTQLERLLEEARQAPFDFENGPLLRVHLFELAEARHLLTLTLPALSADLPALQKLPVEIADTYAASLAGEQYAAEPMQYADLSEWQNELLEQEDGSAGQEYWRRQEPRTSRLLKLPSEDRELDGAGYVPRSVRASIPAPLVAGLEELAAARGCSVRALLLACWQTLLWRLTREPEIVCRVAMDGRQYAELENAQGLCARFVPVGTRFDKSIPFIELVEAVEENVREVGERQEYFIEEAVAPQDAEKGGLRIGFEFMRWPPSHRAAGLAFSFCALRSRFDRLDLKLSCFQKGETITAELDYDSLRLRRETVERLAENFRALLRGVVARPRAAIGRLEVLGDEERELLLRAFNQTSVEAAGDLCVHQLFKQQAEKSPSSVALVFGEERLTYLGLDERAERLARRLRARGVAPEVTVGICVERSVEMIVGILGILKAGGAYLPLDPTYPKDRLAFMLEDTRAPVLLTQSRLVEHLPAHAPHVICLDEESETPGQASAAPARPPAPENAAYVIYTSGSTGKPKGVVVTHRNLCHSTAARFDYYRQPLESFLLTSSFAFDSSVAGIFWTLCSGGTLFLPEEGAHREVTRLAELMTAHRISHSLMLPSLHALLLEHAQEERLELTSTFIVAGEACPVELIRRHVEIAPRAELHNEYGPTECTVWSTADDCCASPRLKGTVPIGRPISNARVYLLDEELQPVPLSSQGELYVGGEGLARGYRNNPELTAERFIPDPFGGRAGARLYRTGDLARYLPDGRLEFLGRADQQVKIRGYRIELREIESALERHGGVKQAVVLAREDNPSEKRLVAYVVAADGRRPSPDELRDFVGEALPDYMMPAAFVGLDELPLMPNGKVDRKALPPPEKLARVSGGEYAAPRNRTEEVLSGIWAQILGVERVGVNDNFFELGGDSIRGIQAVARANRAGLQLTTHQLFQNQTVARLACVAGTAPAVQAEQGTVRGAVTLTPIQRWFFEGDLPEPHHFNQSVLLEVDGGLDFSLLEASVRLLVAHHDALRLRFVRAGRDWQQFHAPPDGRAPVAQIKLPSSSEEESRAALEAAVAEAQSTLNLSEGPILRVTLFKSEGGANDLLHLTVHHLAVDGVSWRILLEDLQLCYEQLARGEEPRLAPKTTSYQYWSQRLAQYAQSETLRQEALYWTSAAGESCDPLPLDFAEEPSSNTVGAARTISRSLDEEETRALLTAVPQSYHVLVNDVLLTALARGFEEWTRARSLLICLESHGRQDIFADVDLSRTVGWFTSLFPVRLTLPGGPDTGAEIKAVKEQLRGVPNHGIGYGLLRHAGGDAEVARRLEALPRAEVLFNYLGNFDQSAGDESPFRMRRESPGSERSLKHGREFLFEVNAYVLGGRLHADWTYGSKLHRRETVEGLASRFVESLRSLIDYCRTAETTGHTPSDFRRSKLNQAELDHVLAKLRAVGEKPV
jgi:amino acid adenylation domain-containing protein/non-ribosomal peptide synthase protein (TIGR01720 family)